jgi:hypothetical protein
MTRSPSVQTKVIRLMPRTTRLCLPDQWRPTRSIFLA